MAVMFTIAKTLSLCQSEVDIFTVATMESAMERLRSDQIVAELDPDDLSFLSYG